MRHDTTSECKLAELQVFGVVYNDLTVSSVASFSTDVMFNDGYNQYTWTNAVEYRQDATPVVSTVSPSTGSVKGSETITLTGSYLGNADIIIDTVQCVVGTNSANSVECVTGDRSTFLPDGNSF